MIFGIAFICIFVACLYFAYSLVKIGSHNHDYKCPECDSYHIVFDEKKLTYIQYKCVSCNATLAFSGTKLYKIQ